MQNFIMDFVIEQYRDLDENGLAWTALMDMVT